MLSSLPLVAAVDWSGLLVPDRSLVESFVRGSAVYLALLAIFRIVLKRQHGSIGLPDVMLVVLVSECVSSSLSADAKSLPNGLVAVLALLFWSYVIDRASYHWPWLQGRLEPEPLPLIRDGKLLPMNLRSEGVTEDELLSQLRLNGVASIETVEAAFLEPEGDVSVLKKEAAAPDAPPRGEAGDVEVAIRRLLDAAHELRCIMSRGAPG